MQHSLAMATDGADEAARGDDEVALIRAAQADPAAFGALYERYVDRVYAYLRVRLGAPEDAAGATQQVFMQALQALPR